MTQQGNGSDAIPLVHPGTGERILFRRRARDTAGELLEVTLYSAPIGRVFGFRVRYDQYSGPRLS